MPARDLRLVVIDRDGTLNQDPEDFLHGPDDWQPLPGALEAIARLNEAGWRVVVASNQAGLGRGLFDLDTLNAIHARMHKAVAQAGGRIEAVFFCPHAPEDACDCRKPAPGLFRQIAARFGTSPSQLVVVGDSVRDAGAGVAAGCDTHLVLTGQSAAWRGVGRPPGVPQAVALHDDLLAFAEALVERDASAGREGAA
ncbi:D-glycero-beta-D-manno-heptose 1,7-bisphosphate 7-phosphatase [Tepidimonas taiwanensis]|uniref:D-glycero-beta-D-manno-heptose-1,7-bisphosphate 7-phosphatase n=1 Tax=Tepidimonas taiwanensis TaxID=307486 RepID=A0A554WZQ2_9BURK|nr:D-glycero-beta-D-manno-heptose 1,7-bisphosphate 7-phosphatase [Tepidimonas taiwanensis]MDM7463195.1 D-glycero-beta-D-manno-heptose 1,7-bisphosphate 7-phosphatase [Tepidimonas taiwanensis]TSE29061.1 D-glycero-beta-D-manno-heptose-1,7-bisphosphate 7-phosphatase [Tepidimonas taiwanensis]UBQ05700.1 D-glycero-beta-D-manno-heptose 1,7-bisphosphate 7-phosphatase [Tepidimonas taiwanensis]